MKRRFFLFVAPAIVAAPSLMRVSAAVLGSLPPPPLMAAYEWKQHSLSFIVTETLRNRSHLLAEQITKNNALLSHLMYADGSTVTRRMGLGSLLTDAEYESATADDWDDYDA